MKKLPSAIKGLRRLIKNEWLTCFQEFGGEKDLCLMHPSSCNFFFIFYLQQQLSFNVRCLFVAGHIVDVDENESTPSAPSVELMDHVVGYEEVSFDASEFFYVIPVADVK